MIVDGTYRGNVFVWNGDCVLIHFVDGVKTCISSPAANSVTTHNVRTPVSWKQVSDFANIMQMHFCSVHPSSILMLLASGYKDQYSSKRER